MKNFNFRKGNLLKVHAIWYVLVGVIWSKETKHTHLLCICDHANNIHCWEPEDVEMVVDTRRLGFNKSAVFDERECPYDVIVEVLNGDHDDRFEELDLYQ